MTPAPQQAPTLRTATLPSGEVLHFPADTPDEHMHMKVRERMGLPPPEPPVDPVAVAQEASMASVQSSQQLAAHVAQSVQQLTGQIGQVIAHLGQVAQGLHAAVTHLTQVSQSTAAASQAVANALTAKKTVTKGKDGVFTLDVVK